MRPRSKNQKKPSTRNTRVVKALTLVIGACLLFCAGFLVRNDDGLMQRLGVVSSADASAADASSVSSDGLSSRVAEVESILQSESLDSFDLDASTSASIEAFLESTNDPFTRYYSDARYTAYVKSSTEEYPGVGVLFAESNGRAYALDVFEGSAAADAGVQPGDFVIAIDGDRSQEWSATEAINAVQRQAGSTVVITWMRPENDDASAGSEFSTSLECSDYEEPNVSIDLVDESVGYIKLAQFTQNSDSLVRQAIDQLSSQGAQSFVLDLRDNPGGYLTKAVDVASLFIRSGVVVEIVTVDASTTKQVSGEVATDAPLVVIVNENTAGSAEVLAAALRDTERATIVGTTTMGKGSVQVTKPLSFGGALRYTAARYKSPDGYSIDQVGVTPSITVSQREGNEADEQLDLAVDTAASMIQQS